MWNDKETDSDLLGHNKIAATIIEIINDSHLRPLTIGIYGDWGVGKSSIISLIQKNINQKNKDKEPFESHCIIFNGWLFQGYEDTKTALMETIVSELASLQPANVKLQNLAASLIKRINWLKVAKVSAGAIWTGLTGLPDPNMLSGIVGVAQKSLKTLGQKEDDGKDINVNQEEEPFINPEKEQTITSQIHAFRREFKTLIETSKVNQVIVLVDDLDRCLPKTVIEILEAIRLFLFVEGTTFVISADEKMIEYAVKDHFPNLPANYSDYTKNYLEKLIQIPIRVPSLNRLQTGNYIKFLLLQFHLNHDYERLLQIYKLFESKKKFPYDNKELNYEIIKEAFGAENPHIKEALLVGDQLSPTLAKGLQGNPRSIKRFLNTLFLRMRIAKIYGLDEIKLNILAKLMLLERFQTDKFEIIVNQVSFSANGISDLIEELEDDKKEDGKKTKSTKTKVNDEDLKSQKLVEWLSLSPPLKSMDLRPYIFISKEKAIGFDTADSFPLKLEPLLEKLRSGATMSLQEARKELVIISEEEAVLIFNKLETECRSTSDLKSPPPAMKGILTIIGVFDGLEERLLRLIESYPPKQLGVWAVSELSGLKKENSKLKFQQILQAWSNQTENKTLRSMANQTLV